MLVSFLTYYDPTCREILELHLRLMADHVDHWVITESNLTHAGRAAPRLLRERLEELDWPQDRVTIIDLDLPSDPVIQEIDHLNTYENYTNRKLGQGDLENLQARARERMQKDSVIAVLAKFPPDTVYLHSDCDEFIDPNHLPYLTRMCRENQNVVIKIPLVYLQGRADLRTHVKATAEPVPWDGGMFLATRNHLQHATPTQIRSTNLNPWPIRYITHDGKRCEDLGWHFSWMGSAQQRLLKSQNFTHYHDDLSWLNSPSYSSEQHQQWIQTQHPAPGEIPPSGDVRHVLMPYDTTKLPPQITQNTALLRYLLPDL